MPPTIHTRCAAPGCHRHPREWSFYCGLHAGKMRRSGDPHGRLLRKEEIAVYVRAIAPTLDTIGDHRSVEAALVYIDALLDGHTVSREEWPWVRRLRDARIEPTLVLLTLAAVVGATKFLKLDDGPNLDANLGNAVLRLVPAPHRGIKPSGAVRYAQPPPTIYKPLGKRIRKHLAPLLHRLWEIEEANYQREGRLKYELSAEAVASLGANVIAGAGKFAGETDLLGRRNVQPEDDPAAIPEPTETSKKARKRRPRPRLPTLAERYPRREPEPFKHSYVPQVPEGFDPEGILRETDDTETNETGNALVSNGNPT